MYDKLQIKQTIKNLYPDCTVILFGSYARNEQIRQSDIDILVLFDQDIDNFERRQIQANIRRELAKQLIAADVLASGKYEYEQKAGITNHIFSTIAKEGVLI